MSSENIRLGLEILDEALPDGVPRSSLLVLAGPGGTGKTFLALIITKRFLLNSEPVIYVTLDDDPASIISRMNRLDVDVYSYIRNKQLMIIDGFSFRIRDKKGKTHFSVVEEVDPQNPEQILYTIIQLIDKTEIKNKGTVVIDSLNEILAYNDISKTAEFLRSLRANISKYRSILTLTILHTSIEKTVHFLSTIEHIADGIILTDQEQRDGHIVKYVVIKRMKGVKHAIDRIGFTISDKELKKV